MDQTDHLAEEFKPAELVLVAEALGLAPTVAWGPRKLVDVIRVKLLKDGVPEEEPEDERQADLLDDFLYVDGWINDSGEIVRDGGGYPETVEEFMKLHNIKGWPGCRGVADDRAPECKRCALYVYCAEERIAALPPCYGIMYAEGDEECRACLEAYYCKGV